MNDRVFRIVKEMHNELQGITGLRIVRIQILEYEDGFDFSFGFDTTELWGSHINKISEYFRCHSAVVRWSLEWTRNGVGLYGYWRWKE